MPIRQRFSSFFTITMLRVDNFQCLSSIIAGSGQRLFGANSKKCTLYFCVVNSSKHKLRFFLEKGDYLPLIN